MNSTIVIHTPQDSVIKQASDEISKMADFVGTKPHVATISSDLTFCKNGIAIAFRKEGAISKSCSRCVSKDVCSYLADAKKAVSGVCGKTSRIQNYIGDSCKYFHEKEE